MRAALVNLRSRCLGSYRGGLDTRLTGLYSKARKLAEKETVGLHVPVLDVRMFRRTVFVMLKAMYASNKDVGDAYQRRSPPH